MEALFVIGGLIASAGAFTMYDVHRMYKKISK